MIGRNRYEDDGLSKHCLANDIFDRNRFEEVRDKAPKIKAAEKTLDAKTPEPFAFAQDLYSALYKANPTLLDQDAVSETTMMHHEIMGLVMDNEQYKKLRPFTEFDPFSSAISVAPMIAEMAKYMPDMRDGGGGDGKEGGDGDGGETPIPAPPLSDEEKERINEAISNACREAHEDVDEAHDCLAGWGCSSGEVQKMDVGQKFDLRSRLLKSDKMRKLSKMIGRSVNLALSAQKTKVKHGSDEVYDIELGNSLGKVLPSEKMMLHSGKWGKLLFLQKFAEQKLMQYKLRSVIREQKGPIVCCIDNSISMAGDPEIWSKALGLGLLEIAVRQKRKLVILHFGAAGDPIKRYDFSQGDAPLSRKIDMAEYFLGGGTNFENVLNKARDIITSELPKADIVMVTDGKCGVKKEWQKDWARWRESKGIKLYSIYVCSGAMGSAKVVFDQIGDEIIHASDLYRHGDSYQSDLYKLI